MQNKKKLKKKKRKESELVLHIQKEWRYKKKSDLHRQKSLGIFT